MLLFAEDQVLFPDPDDDFQRALYTLHNTAEQFVIKMSLLKSTVMAFKGRVPVASKIVIDDTVLEQINTFTYLGCRILYEEGKDITSKVSTFL
jgi:hypothetical protein